MLFLNFKSRQSVDPTHDSLTVKVNDINRLIREAFSGETIWWPIYLIKEFTINSNYKEDILT